LALHGAAGQKGFHPVAGLAPAGPLAAGLVGAVLAQFGRIEPQEANAIPAHAETVAIADAGCAGNGRWRRVQGSGQHGA